MSSQPHVADVRFGSAPPDLVATGLLGWAGFTVDGSLRLDGVAVRRTLDGRYTLAFPVRRDVRRRRHFFVRPLDDCARREIERQVLGALGFLEEAR
jgi:hypothetical protein